MPSLHISDLSFAYSSALAVLDGANFDLGAGWAGLVGGNGSGKTTLLLVALDAPLARRLTQTTRHIADGRVEVV